jgi:hypothetical protein
MSPPLGDTAAALAIQTYQEVSCHFPVGSYVLVLWPLRGGRPAACRHLIDRRC